MRIGVIAPSESELTPFLGFVEEVSETKRAGFRFFEGRHSGKQIVCVICGICKTNTACATQILIKEFGVSHVFMIGVCGAINASLDINDTVVCTLVAHHDVEGAILTENEPAFRSAVFECDRQLLQSVQIAEMQGLGSGIKLFYGKEVSGEQFVGDEGREAIIAKHAPMGVDMETAAAAQVCALNEVPFLALRTVTDTPAQSGLEIFGQNFSAASKISAKVLHEALKQL